jgi:CHAT domain-containing protein
MGIQAYHRQNISKQRISQAIISLRNSLNVDSLQRSRRIIRQTNNKPDIPVDSSPKLSREQSITELTQILLPDLVASKLGTVEHLIIVPILEIGTVPYALLKPFKDNSFLVDKMSISISSSLFDLSMPLSQSSLKRSYRSALIIGNPYFPTSDDWTVPALPSAEQEAIAASKILNTTPLIGKKATKLEVLAKVEKARFLYFATHGVASNLNPLSDSFLVFSADSIEKGLWTAKEIQNSKLNAEIAVLSACQTGLGKSHDAGIIGLGRAFQIAGVPRVVMSLWSVDDQATSNLMQSFINYLQTNIPSEALRKAMLKMKQKYSEPALWASFVVFGTPR